MTGVFTGQHLSISRFAKIRIPNTVYNLQSSADAMIMDVEAIVTS